MSAYFVFVKIVVVIVLLNERVGAVCPNGWTRYEQSCYFFGHAPLDFHNTEIFCKHYNATMAEIETPEENNFLRSYLSDLKDPNHWIGLTDAVIEGEWRWYSNDVPARYVDWYPGEPNNGKVYNCAMIYGPYNHHWVDAPCNSKYFPLCELRSLMETEVIGK